jgi:hypothetical protein
MMTTEGNNKLTLHAVKVAVYSWSIRNREAGYTNEQLARLSQEYFEDLQSEEVTAHQFAAAASRVRKRCRFFPKMVDILEAVQQHRESPPAKGYLQDQVADTTSNHDLTQEEIDRNKERTKHITDMLARKLSMDEAIEAVEKSNHIQEFKV